MKRVLFSVEVEAGRFFVRSELMPHFAKEEFRVPFDGTAPSGKEMHDLLVKAAAVWDAVWQTCFRDNDKLVSSALLVEELEDSEAPRGKQ